MKIKRELRITVVYDVDRADGDLAAVDRALKATLRKVADHAAGEGWLTGDLATVVDHWSAKVVNIDTPRPTWTDIDDALAFREGWILTDVGGRLDIQRVDELDVFENDDAALEHIREQAGKGSVLHEKALVLHGMPLPAAAGVVANQEHTVAWSIELDAATPRQAAEQARAILRDPTSIATIFKVIDPDGVLHNIDLAPGDTPE